jgi:hypothetical protein
MQLERYNTNLQMEQQSTDLSLLIDNDEQPNFLIEKNDYLYLNYPNNGIMIFDYAGNYIKKIAVKGINNIYVDGNNISYYLDNKIIINNTMDFTKEEIVLPDTIGVLNASLTTGRLFVFKEGLVSVYNISN